MPKPPYKKSKKGNELIGARVDPELKEKLDEIALIKRTDRSTEIIIACEEYVERFFSKSQERITESKYTLEQKKEAIYNDQLRDEILKNSPKEEIRLMYEEISQIKKIVLEKIKEK